MADEGIFRRYLVSAFGANLVLPIFYIFLPLLAHRLGADTLELGLVGGAVYGVYSFMPFIMGHFSDRIGTRKFFIIAALLILAVVSVFYTVISSPAALIITRVFEGIGWAILWPAMEAAIVEDKSRNATRALSMFNFTWSGAAALGPIVGAVLVFYTSIQFAFFVTALILLVVLFVNLFPILFAHGNKRRSRVRKEEEVQGNPLSQASKPNADTFQPELKGNGSGNGRTETKKFYILTTALAATSPAILYTFFPPYAESIGISVLSIGVITFMLAGGRFAMYLASTNNRIRQRILKQDARKRTIVASLGLGALSSLLLAIPDKTGVLYYVAFALVGIGYSMTFAIAQVTLIVETNPKQMGRGAGLFESSIGVGGTVGPIVSGLVSHGSLIIPFLVPAFGFAMTLSAISLLAEYEKERVRVQH
jgi:MFS family permease